MTLYGRPASLMAAAIYANPRGGLGVCICRAGDDLRPAELIRVITAVSPTGRALASNWLGFTPIRHVSICRAIYSRLRAGRVHNECRPGRNSQAIVARRCLPGSRHLKLCGLTPALP